MKKLNFLLLVMFLLTGYSFSEEKSQKLAENIPGKFTFSSHRTSNGKLYTFLLENGKIENLGIESDYMRISPNGKLGVGFISDSGLVIYDFKKKKIVKNYDIKYEHTVGLDWTKNSKYLILDAKEEIDKAKDIYNTYLLRLRVKDGNIEILKKYEKLGYWYGLKNINVAPDNKRMVMTVGVSGEYDDENKMVKIYVTDIDGQNARMIWRVGTPLGWYPDNKNILIHTNRSENGEMINNTEGRLYKINVDTLEKKIVEETVPYVYTMEKLSKDGKYIYSVRYFPKLMAWNLVLGEVGKRQDEIMLTYPVPFEYNSQIRYSDDSAPDWWYK